jgi:ABC-type multidrug transport system fused ATPase/permease subunit
LLPTARTHSEEITRLLTSSTDTNQQISGLLNQQNSNLETIKERIKEEKEIFDEFSADLKQLKESYTEQISITTKHNATFEKQLETILDKSKTFDERIKVLNELIGKEGAVKLFNTFNDRKKELEEPVKNWAKVVFGTGIFALALIIGIFTNFFGLVGGYPTAIDWHYLLINSLKSVPVMIVLYFAIKQYVRERSYQEEYAFRSAIALTVQAYGDIAGSKKEDLISKAVENIYNMPTMMKERNGLFSFKTRQLTETLKELNETIKNVKP